MQSAAILTRCPIVPHQLGYRENIFIKQSVTGSHFGHSICACTSVNAAQLSKQDYSITLLYIAVHENAAASNIGRLHEYDYYATSLHVSQPHV